MKKFLVIALASVMTTTALVGYAAAEKLERETAKTETVVTVGKNEMPQMNAGVDAYIASIEEEIYSHEHSYTEEITAEATCETDGSKTFTCECGDTYDEVITSTGHIFETYVSNEDATYTADGTETATCSNCEVTDTRVAEGSMLTYSFTDMDATMYAQQTVNVRSLPNTDGEKLGSLSTNDEVKVTGQCVETGWYRFELDGTVVYASNSFLNENKVVEQPKTEAPAQASVSSECPYQLWTMYDNGSVAWFYMTKDHGYSQTYWNAYNACHGYNRARYSVVDGQAPEFDVAVAAAGASSRMNPTPWYVNGQRVYQYFGF